MSHSITLAWVASVDPVEGYNVYRSTAPGAEVAPALNGSTPVTVLTYVDSTVSVGQKYDYVITAVVNGLESVHSNEVVSAVIIPFPPTDLAITASN
jgi:fibronectin type 3 domain-containing protein